MEEKREYSSDRSQHLPHGLTAALQPFVQTRPRFAQTAVMRQFVASGASLKAAAVSLLVLLLFWYV